jgi:hypothetical protein
VPDGCSRKFHQPAGNASGSISVTPYIEFLPWVKIGFGNVIYGKATCSIKPTVNFLATFDSTVSSNVSIAVNVYVPIIFNFVAGYSVNIVIMTKSDEQSFGPFEIANPSWNYSTTIDLKAIVQSLGAMPSLRQMDSLQRHASSTFLTLAASSCSCDTPYATMIYTESNASASSRSSTTSWSILSGSDIDTCESTTVTVDATTMLFTAPATGNYDIRAAVADIASQSRASRWFLMARVGSRCCGGVIFCAEVSLASPSWSYSNFFLQQNATLTLVWSSSSSGTSATIDVVISQNQNPTVYVDVEGSNSDDGSYSSPVATLQHGLTLLATLIGPKTTTATIVLGPNEHSSTATSPLIPSGFQIPSVFRRLRLTIRSQISRKATSIFDAWTQQAYCNYNIQQCTSKASFEDSTYGTSFDTEIQGCVQTDLFTAFFSYMRLQQPLCRRPNADTGKLLQRYAGRALDNRFHELRQWWSYICRKLIIDRSQLFFYQQQRFQHRIRSKRCRIVRQKFQCLR